MEKTVFLDKNIPHTINIYAIRMHVFVLRLQCYSSAHLVFRDEQN